MMLIPKRTFYFINKIIFLLFLIGDTLSEMIIKESKVDPFSLLLDNQRQILDKMDFIVTKLKTVDVMESTLSSLTFAISSTNNRLDRTQYNIEILNEGVRNISEEITQLKTNQLRDISRHNFRETFNKRSPCYDLINNFKNGMQDVLKCNSILALYIESHHKINTNKNTPDVLSNTVMRNAVHYTGIEEDYSNISQSNLMRADGDKIVSDITMVIDSKINHTNDHFIRVLSLLHNIEYRQHVSTITQDRRLNTLLHKIALHKSVLEERITNSFLTSLDRVEQDFEEKLQIIKDHLNNDKSLFNSVTNMVTKLSLSINNLTALNTILNRQTNPKSELDHSQNNSQSRTTAEAYSLDTDNSPSTPSTLITTFKEFIPQNNTTINPPIISNTTLDIEEKEEYSNSSGEVLGINFLIFGPHANNTDTKETKNSQVTQKTQILEEVIHIEENALEEKEVPLPIKNHTRENEIQTQELTGIMSKFLDEQVITLQTLMNDRMSATAEKLTGLRIHQASTIYSHTKEIRYEIEKAERELSETVRSIGTKLSKKIEGARNSLYTFIDAAVTSISSAAVTSAQSMGMQVAKALKLTMKDVEKKIEQSNNIKKEVMGCPEMYQRVGGKCFLVLNNIETSWKNGCRLCKALGGELAYFSQQSDILTLSEILRLNPLQELWITNSGKFMEEMSCDFKSEKEEEEELTNSVANEDINDVLYKYQNGTDIKCNILNVANLKLKTTSCIENLGVICQYHIKNYLYSKTFTPNASQTPLIHDDVIENVSYRKNKYF